MKAMILAAGEGKRLRPLTEQIPKAMLEINGHPIIFYQLKLLRKYGVRDVIINLNYKPEKIESYLENNNFGMNIKFSHEKELLGTAGGVKKAEYFFDEDFFVIYGDIITDINLGEVYKFHEEKNGIATLCVHKIPRDKQSTSVISLDKNQRITKLVEKPTKYDTDLIERDYKYVNSGIYVLKKNILEKIPENTFSDFAIDIFPKLLNEEKLFGYVHEKCYWAELGRLEKYNNIKNEIENRNIRLNI